MPLADATLGGSLRSRVAPAVPRHSANDSVFDPLREAVIRGVYVGEQRVVADSRPFE
jgi:hypothetical protein